MKTHHKIIAAITFAAVITIAIIIACNKEDDFVTPGNSNQPVSSQKMLTTSINSTEVCLVTGSGMNIGNVTVTYDDINVFVTYNINLENTDLGWRIMRTHTFAGDCNTLLNEPLTVDGNPVPAQFPYHSLEALNTNTYTVVVPRNTVTNSFCIAAYADVTQIITTDMPDETAWGCGTPFSRSKWETYFKYAIPGTVTCDGFLTVPQGKWGSPSNGNKPSAYLNDHFAQYFPEGLTVGCTYKATFTSADAIRNCLPQGGTPVMLSSDYTNPSAKKISVLLGQVAALKLNVVFDERDPDFAPGNVSLGDLIITTGVFGGRTVNELHSIAESVLGGCKDSPFSTVEVNDAVTAVNENYDVGKSAGTFLTCRQPM